MANPPQLLAAFGTLTDAFSNPAPLPAGGAAAVISIAMGAALGRKIVHRSRGGDRAAVARLGADLERCLSSLAPDLDADCAAFEDVLAALRRPRDDIDRADALRAAWRAATSAPIAVARLAAEIDRLLDALAPHANQRMAGDLAAARALVTTGARIAAANARENAAHLDDPSAVLAALPDDPRR